MSIRRFIAGLTLAFVPSALALATPPSHSQAVYEQVFRTPFNAKVDGALVATAGGVDLGAFTGDRGGEQFVFVANDIVGISASATPCSQTNLLVSWEQLRTGASYRELEASGTLVTSVGAVEVTVEVIDLRAAGNRGFLLIPVPPSKSHLPSAEIPAQRYFVAEPVVESSTHAAGPVPECQDFWDNRDCNSYGACAAGPEPVCSERPPADATVDDCIEAARCRRDKRNWASNVAFHSCCCEGFETAPIYWIRCGRFSIPVPNDCHVTWAAERAAVAVLYATEASACVPQIQIQRPPSTPQRPRT